MLSPYEDQLSAIASSSFSEAHAPQHRGEWLISELTASNVATSIAEEDKEEFSEKYNVGALLSSVSKNIVLEDNKEYGIAYVHDLCDRNLDSLCCEKRRGGKNTFCTRANCDLVHRTNSSRVKVDLDSIIIMRAKDAAFINPISSIKLVSKEVLHEWKSQVATLLGWNKRFLLCKSAEQSLSSKQDLTLLKEFSQIASSHKTPSKPPKVDVTLTEFTLHDHTKLLKGIKI